MGLLAADDPSASLVSDLPDNLSLFLVTPSYDPHMSSTTLRTMKFLSPRPTLTLPLRIFRKSGKALTVYPTQPVLLVRYQLQQSALVDPESMALVSQVVGVGLKLPLPLPCLLQLQTPGLAVQRSLAQVF